jgi:hypothetical protein
VPGEEAGEQVSDPVWAWWDHKAFGMKFDPPLQSGNVMIADKVRIVIDVTAVKEAWFPPQSAAWWDLAVLRDDALAFVPDADREVILTVGDFVVRASPAGPQPCDPARPLSRAGVRAGVTAGAAVSTHGV